MSVENSINKIPFEILASAGMIDDVEVITIHKII